MVHTIYTLDLFLWVNILYALQSLLKVLFIVSYLSLSLQNASNIADDIVEPHPLWEYPGVPLTNTFDLLNLDLSKPLKGVKTVERDGYISVWE